MSPQRASGYTRRAAEDYPSPPWVATALTRYLRTRALYVWEPAAGNGSLAKALAGEGFRVTASADDFFKRTKLPHAKIDAIVTNPPYGATKGGKLAAEFIRHALTFNVDTVAMLLRIDFDSAKTRVDLFRDSRTFAGKIVLLDRVKWFDGPSSPSDNHCWAIWNRVVTKGLPWIRYATKDAD